MTGMVSTDVYVHTVLDNVDQLYLMSFDVHTYMHTYIYIFLHHHRNNYSSSSDAPRTQIPLY